MGSKERPRTGGIEEKPTRVERISSTVEQKTGPELLLQQRTEFQKIDESIDAMGEYLNKLSEKLGDSSKEKILYKKAFPFKGANSQYGKLSGPIFEKLDQDEVVSEEDINSLRTTYENLKKIFQKTVGSLRKEFGTQIDFEEGFPAENIEQKKTGTALVALQREFFHDVIDTKISKGTEENINALEALEEFKRRARHYIRVVEVWLRKAEPNLDIKRARNHKAALKDFLSMLEEFEQNPNSLTEKREIRIREYLEDMRSDIVGGVKSERNTETVDTNEAEIVEIIDNEDMSEKDPKPSSASSNAVDFPSSFSDVKGMLRPEREGIDYAARSLRNSILKEKERMSTLLNANPSLNETTEYAIFSSRLKELEDYMVDDDSVAENYSKIRSFIGSMERQVNYLEENVEKIDNAGIDEKKVVPDAEPVGPLADQMQNKQEVTDPVESVVPDAEPVGPLAEKGVGIEERDEKTAESPELQKAESSLPMLAMRASAVRKSVEEKGGNATEAELEELRHAEEKLDEQRRALSALRQKAQEHDNSKDGNSPAAGDGEKLAVPEVKPESRLDDEAVFSKTHTQSVPRIKRGGDYSKKAEVQEGGPVTPDEQKMYESRLELRIEWKEKKEQYENAYRKYLEDLENEKANRGVFKKMLFRGKEKMPDSLSQLKEEYRTAKRSYADVLDGALSSRFVKNASNPDERIASLRTAFANRFVINSAHDQLKIERGTLPAGKSSQTLEGIQNIFKKHGRKIRLAGYTATIAAAVVTGGGIIAVTLAVGGKFARAKLIAGGAAGGALAGGYIGASVVERRRQKRNIRLENAQKNLQLDNLNSLEDDYVNAYRGYLKAEKDQKYWSAGGALAGAAFVGGASAVENVLNDGIPIDGEVSDLPDAAETKIPQTIDDLKQPVFGDINGSGIDGSPAEKLPTSEYLPYYFETPSEGEAAISGEDIPVASTKVVPEEAATPESGQETPDVPSKPRSVLGDVWGSESPTAPEEITPDEGSEIMPETTREPVSETPAPDSSADTEDIGNDVPEKLYMIPESGEKFVSNALYDTWKQDPSLVDIPMTQQEFLDKMWEIRNELEADPTGSREFLESMRIDSGDIDEVQKGQVINLQPFFERMSK